MSSGALGKPLLYLQRPVRQGGGWEGVGGVGQSFQAEAKNKMLWQQQTTPLVCGVGYPVKIEIDEAKKIKLGAVHKGSYN